MEPDLNYLFKSTKPSAIDPVAATSVASYKSVSSILLSISSSNLWKPALIPLILSLIVSKYSAALMLPS